MKTRSYNDIYPDETAGVIALEVVRNGTSSGWIGSKELVSITENMLRVYNIGYIDDMTGTWKFVKGGSKFY